MRSGIAIVIVATIVIALGVAVGSRFVGGGPVATTAAYVATPAPFTTADPSVTSRVDPEVTRGRLDPGDAHDHRRIVVRGLALPIAGVALPTDPDLLPNAPRDYRAGWHEGIDFPAKAGTLVHAVAAGTIVRIDRDFADWSDTQEQAAVDEARRLGYTPAATLDRLRGRQVWIDHGNGIVSRYCHLSTVADLNVGDHVSTGDVVGAVGTSGYPEGGPHLHFEIRIGSSYLGDGLSGDALLTAIGEAFE